MSYLVLARKYRPGSFADIVGQPHVVQTLENAIALDRVHHAFLFTGARGVGKTTTARVLARALNCESGPTATPCGECSSCQEIAGGRSPDVLEIDGASNTGVDNVRELRENARYLPSRARNKLYIIDEVHMLSQAAFNALLKTLEEPPPHVKFIFATTEPHRIPITILSRCQRFDFRRVSVKTLADHLQKILKKEEIELGSTVLSTIVREAQGSVRDALSLLDQVLSYIGGEAASQSDEQVLEALRVVDRQTVFTICEHVLKREAQGVLDQVAALDERGHDLPQVAMLVAEHFRDLTVVKVVDAPTGAVLDRSPGERQQLEQQAEHASRVDLHRLFSVAATVAEDVTRSLQPRVSLEMGLLRLMEIEPSQNLSTLLDRMDQAIAQAGPVTAKAPRVERGSIPPSGQTKPISAPPIGVKPKPKPTANSERSTPRGSSHTGWERLVDRVRQKGPALASVLEHARVLAFDPEKVEIGFEAGTFYFESACEPDSRRVLIESVENHFSQPVNVVITELDREKEPPTTSTLAEQAEKKKKQRRAQLHQEAVSHPAVQDAQRILGGEISQVTSLEPSSEGRPGSRSAPEVHS